MDYTRGLTGRTTVRKPRRPSKRTSRSSAKRCDICLDRHGDVLVASHGTLLESRAEVGRLGLKLARKTDLSQIAVRDGEAVFKEMFIHPSTD